jgi:hypothetical protein
MASRPYTVDLPDGYIVKLEQLARELGVSPGKALQVVTGDLQRAKAAGMVATADGAEPAVGL